MGFCDSGALVLNSTFVLIFGIGVELSIFAFNPQHRKAAKC